MRWYGAAKRCRDLGWRLGAGVRGRSTGDAVGAKGDPLVLHARMRDPGKAVQGAAHDAFVATEKTVEWNPLTDGDHHLRHVEPALVPGGDPAGRRAGPGDEPGDRRRPCQRRLHHPRPQQLHGPLQRSPRPQAGAGGAQGGQLPAGYRRVVQQDSGRGKRGLSDRPVRRRLRRRAAVPTGSPWKSQVAAIEIKDDDAISDSGTEIWNLLESRGIKNVMLMGVHTNMCVLGRPFGLRNLARSGKNVVLVRDLTDTMYNSRKWPYVSHFEGTNRIVEHIEKYVAPTITSTDLTGQPAFQFKADNRPRAVFLIGEDEYKTETTLPAFAAKELEPRGVRCTFVIADPEGAARFPGRRGFERRRSPGPERPPPGPTAEQMAIIRKYIDSGKPLVGIRTACHAFDARGKAPGPRRMEVVRSRRAGGALHGPPSQRCPSRDLYRAGAQIAPDHRRTWKRPS